MCAILDANVVYTVFGSRSSTECPQIGLQLLDWLNSGKGRLVTGGKAKEELYYNGNFQRWVRQKSRAGGRIVVYEEKMSRKEMLSALVVEYGDTEIEAEIRWIKKQKLPKKMKPKSNDLHVIALARISGARLLYSDDKKLRKDFKNKHLVNSPRGKVYSKEDHQHLLDQNLCRQ
ncbi:MAG: PIN domain-containing protein [Nitrospira sp.]|nr:PIN domain-containing protein [Nitrospira sp.]